jgi:hypothetical protein
MIRSVLKVVHFLRTKKRARFGGTFLHSHTQLNPEKGIRKFPRHFSTKTLFYYSRTITNLTNIWHRLEQP